MKFRNFLRTLILISVLLNITTIVVAYLIFAEPDDEFTDIFYYTEVRFSSIDDWRDDVNIKDAYNGMVSSCLQFIKNCDSCTVTTKPIETKAIHWKRACNYFMAEKNISNERMYELFEMHFKPYRIREKGGSFFTGYYTITLRGSRTKSGVYKYPVYKLPDDVVALDLSSYIAGANNKIYGTIHNGKFFSYFDRREINKGILEGRDLEIVYVDNDIDLFMMHVQGSGNIILEDGSVLRMKYDGYNGHKYTSIGSVIVKKGLAGADELDYFKIIEVLNENPDLKYEILNENQSYIFFKESNDDFVEGAFNVPLKAMRSIAVDRNYISLGLPVWVSTTYPGTTKDLNLMMYAHDVGSAIKGSGRGDIYWGSDGNALYWAGRTKQKGSMYVFIPKVAVDD